MAGARHRALHEPRAGRGSARRQPRRHLGVRSRALRDVGGGAGVPGSTTDEILKHVASTEPDWALLPPALPPAVQSLLRRCLQKDSARRLRHITDARFQIEEALEPPGPPASMGTAGARLSDARVALLASALVVVLAGVWLAWPAAPASVPATVRFEIGVRFRSWSDRATDGDIA